MLSEDYLVRRIVSLQPAEEWQNQCEGLSFICPEKGTANYTSGSGTISHCLEVGDLAILGPAINGTVQPSTGNELVFHHFSARMEHLIGLFAAKEISLLQSLYDSFSTSRVYRSNHDVARECRGLLNTAPAGPSLKHRCHMLEVLASILTSELEDLGGQRTGFIRADDHFRQTIDELTCSDIINLTVTELSERFGCCRRHLNRLFHQFFGMSVATLKMEMRLLKAVTLLQNPDCKVINAAEGCGFNHLGLFNSRFKKRFGMTPGQWRRQAASNALSPVAESERPLPAAAATTSKEAAAPSPAISAANLSPTDLTGPFNSLLAKLIKQHNSQAANTPVVTHAR